MNRVLTRSLAVATAVSSLGVLGGFASPAIAAGTVCATNSGSVTFSPGLTSTAKVQNIVAKGSLGGCTGSTVTSGTYVAKLKSSKAETCNSAAGVGETATGSIVIKWSPKGQGNSTASLTLTRTESGAALAGTIEKGLFTGDGASGAIETFAPMFKSVGEQCSAKNPLKKAAFTGSAVTVS